MKKQLLPTTGFGQTFYLNFSFANPIADNTFCGFWFDTSGTRQKTHSQFELSSERGKNFDEVNMICFGMDSQQCSLESLQTQYIFTS